MLSSNQILVAVFVISMLIGFFMYWISFSSSKMRSEDEPEYKTLSTSFFTSLLWPLLLYPENTFGKTYFGCVGYAIHIAAAYWAAYYFIAAVFGA